MRIRIRRVVACLFLAGLWPLGHREAQRTPEGAREGIDRPAQQAGNQIESSAELGGKGGW